MSTTGKTQEDSKAAVVSCLVKARIYITFGYCCLSSPVVQQGSNKILNINNLLKHYKHTLLLTPEFIRWACKIPTFWSNDTSFINQPANKKQQNVINSNLWTTQCEEGGGREVLRGPRRDSLPLHPQLPEGRRLQGRHTAH